MGFRGKLALVFASLLIVAVSAISVMEFERTTRLMVSNLNDTGRLARQPGLRADARHALAAANRSGRGAAQ